MNEKDWREFFVLKNWLLARIPMTDTYGQHMGLRRSHAHPFSIIRSDELPHYRPASRAELEAFLSQELVTTLLPTALSSQVRVIASGIYEEDAKLVKFAEGKLISYALINKHFANDTVPIEGAFMLLVSEQAA